MIFTPNFTNLEVSLWKIQWGCELLVHCFQVVVLMWHVDGSQLVKLRYCGPCWSLSLILYNIPTHSSANFQSLTHKLSTLQKENLHPDTLSVYPHAVFTSSLDSRYGSEAPIYGFANLDVQYPVLSMCCGANKHVFHWFTKQPWHKVKHFWTICLRPYV